MPARRSPHLHRRDDPADARLQERVQRQQAVPDRATADPCGLRLREVVRDLLLMDQAEVSRGWACPDTLESPPVFSGALGRGLFFYPGGGASPLWGEDRSVPPLWRDPTADAPQTQTDVSVSLCGRVPTNSELCANNATMCHSQSADGLHRKRYLICIYNFFGSFLET